MVCSGDSRVSAFDTDSFSLISKDYVRVRLTCEAGPLQRTVMLVSHLVPRHEDDPDIARWAL